MRMATALLIGLMALVAARGAQAAPQVWQGGVFIESTNGGVCTTSGVASVGDSYTLIYRPIISGGQQGPEGLTFVGTRNALHYYTLTSTTSFSTNATDNIVLIGSHAEVATGTGAHALIILPTNPTLLTPTITITGSLNNFWNIAGCTVTLSAALVERVD